VGRQHLFLDPATGEDLPAQRNLTGHPNVIAHVAAGKQRSECDGHGDTCRWPVPDPQLEDEAAIATGEVLLAVASAVRRFKSEESLSLGAELACVELATPDEALRATLLRADPDLRSVTRARELRVLSQPSPDARVIAREATLRIAVLY
jgi:valyl-tRNA synthetase